MAFKKGQAPGPGRPAGSKNKNCMNPVHWFNLIDEAAEAMPAAEKIAYAFRALELLMAKVQSLPATPGDSRSNADQALAELKAAEEYGINRNDGAPPAQPGSHGADVEAGSAQGEATA